MAVDVQKRLTNSSNSWAWAIMSCMSLFPFARYPSTIQIPLDSRRREPLVQKFGYFLLSKKVKVKIPFSHHPSVLSSWIHLHTIFVDKYMSGKALFNFGPWPIGSAEVFFTSRLSYGLVNLKPVVPGRTLSP